MKKFLKKKYIILKKTYIMNKWNTLIEDQNEIRYSNFQI